MHLAAHAGLFKTVRLLLKAGADVYAKNRLGKTPRDVAKGNLALHKYLDKIEKEYLKEFLKRKACESVGIGKELDLYGQLYDGFRTRDIETLKKICKNDDNEVAAGDSVYLIGRMKEKHPKIYLKKVVQENFNSFASREAKFALKEIKMFESKIIYPKSIIGPRVNSTSQVRKIKRNDSIIPED